MSVAKTKEQEFHRDKRFLEQQIKDLVTIRVRSGFLSAVDEERLKQARKLLRELKKRNQYLARVTKWSVSLTDEETA